MDKRPDMPENNKNEIDDILEIMRKRNTKIILSPSPENETNSVVTENVNKNDFQDITQNKAIQAESNITKTDSEKTDRALNGSTVIIPAASETQSFQGVSANATITDIDAVKKHPNSSNVVPSEATEPKKIVASEPTKIDIEPAVVTSFVKNNTEKPDAENIITKHDKTIRETDSGAVSLDDFNKEEIQLAAAKGTKKKQKVKTSFLGSGWFGLIKVTIYLSCVLLVSVLLALTVINVANDIFAFVKPSEIVTKIPDKSDVGDIEKLLKKNNVIKPNDENHIIVTIKTPGVTKETNTVENILKDREISEAIDVCGITVDPNYTDHAFTMKIPSGASAGAIAGILNDAGATEITYESKKIAISENASADDILIILQQNRIPQKGSVTTLAVNIIPEISVSNDILNVLSRDDVSAQLKHLGVTKTSELTSNSFEIVFPKGVGIKDIAKFLDSVDARSITTNTEVTVVVKENATTDDIAKMLKDAGIIKYPGIFKIYADFRIEKRSYLTGKYRADQYKLSPTMNYDTLLDTLSDYERDVSGTVRVTIPEGLTVDETIDLLVQKGVGKKEDYYKALQEFEYEYRFTKELVPGKISEHRFNTEISYRLEGYLFPDTYDFYLNENPISVLDKMLKNFDKKFEEEYYERCEQLGITVDEAITLASMVEKEGNNNKDFYMISLVFNNRLKDKSGRFKSLGSDATTQYALRDKGGDLYNIDVNFLHPYNTRNVYVHGLPPGPICNPSFEAINAALYPANLDNLKDTNYYYFYTKKNGETVFSKTEAAHNNVVAKDRQSN